MTTSAIRKWLYSYLKVANDKKAKAIYALLEEDLMDEAEAKDHWNNPEFVAEMNGRTAEMESGSVQGSSWEEVHNRVRQKAILYPLTFFNLIICNVTITFAL